MKSVRHAKQGAIQIRRMPSSTNWSFLDSEIAFKISRVFSTPQSEPELE
jgi:hypothetical protein